MIPGARLFPGKQRWAIGLTLLAATALVFGQTARQEFIQFFDDDEYVTRNPWVLRGLTPAGLRWAFTTFQAANWHPLTWLSHMTDVQLFGVRAGAHHLVSVVFHAAAAQLLFFVLRAMTGNPWRSAFVAAVFAVHPLHVESVAWVAERKDVLSGLLGLATMGAYLCYVRRRTAGRYALVVAGYALGLMSKPTLVTLPFVLVLLDFWPLGRLAPRRGGCVGAPASAAQARSGAARALVEKIPLLALAAAGSHLTLLAQHRGEAVHLMEPAHLGLRIANALESYGTYLWQALWPRGLVIHYPLPVASPPAWQTAALGAALAGATIFCLLARRRAPFLITGWFWYAGMLVPMIGIIQAGGQARADRYTYLPLIGASLALTWGIGSIGKRRTVLRSAAAGAAVASLLVLGAIARRQTVFWRDDLSLFRHGIAVAGLDSSLCVINLGAALMERGESAEAQRLFVAALAQNDAQPIVHFNLALILDQQGNTDEALAHYAASIRLMPTNAQAHNNLGVILTRRGRAAEALSHYEAAVGLQPDNAESRFNLGVALFSRGDYSRAASHLGESLRLDPGIVQARFYLRETLRRIPAASGAAVR